MIDAEPKRYGSMRRAAGKALKPRVIIAIFLILTVASILSVAVHEGGHLVTALLLKVKILRVTIFGVQVFPEFAFLKGGFNAGVVEREAGYDWQNGLIKLMGTGTSAALSYLLLTCIMALKRLRPWLRTFLLIMSLECAWDIISYAFLPLMGLPNRLIYGKLFYPEPLIGAALLGMNRTAMIVMIGLHGILFHLLFAVALAKRCGGERTCG